MGELVKWAKGSGVGYSSVQELCENEAAVSAVQVTGVVVLEDVRRPQSVLAEVESLLISRTM